MSGLYFWYVWRLKKKMAFWQVAEWKSVHWYFAPGAWDIVEIEQDSDWPE